MVNLSRLEGFYWVARVGGFSAAARHFPYPISPAGVHQQVKRLEVEVGSKLFERLGRDRMVLTSAGERLFAYVGPLIEGLSGEVRALSSGELKGRIRIHAAGQVIRHLVPAWLQRLRRRHPGVEVDLSETGPHGAEAVVTGQTDLLIDVIRDSPPELETKRVARLRAWWILPADRRRAQAKKFSPALLAGQPFVGYRPSQFQRTFQAEALRAFGLHPPRIHSADSAETILGLVAARMGYSLIPWLGRTPPRWSGVSAYPIHDPRAVFDVVAAYRRTAAADPILHAVLEAAPAISSG